MTPRDEVEWIDFAAAAALLGVGERTLERLVAEAVLPVYRLDASNPRSKRLFRRQDVEALPQPAAIGDGALPVVGGADRWYAVLQTMAVTASDEPVSDGELDELVGHARASLAQHERTGVPTRIAVYAGALFGLVEHYKAGTATLAEVASAYSIIAAAARWRDGHPLASDGPGQREDLRHRWHDVFARMARSLLAEYGP